MQSYQPEKRQRRAEPKQMPPAVKYRKKKRRVLNVLVCAVLIALVAIVVIVSPKKPVQKAYYSAGSQDNLVHSTGGALSNYEGLVFSEVMAANRTAMPDENGNYPDWLEIWNSSDHAINLKDVGLSNKGTSIKFLFPDMELAAGERVIVLCDKKNQAIAGKPMHAKFSISSNGEELYIYDPNAYLIDSVKTPILGVDESYARLPDGSWGTTNEYSPGYENTTSGHQEYRAATLVTDGAVIINEVCPDPLTGYTDASGNVCDWVELYNTTNQVISLDNYALSDNESKPLQWRFPEGATIQPHGYYLVYCNGDETPNTDPNAVPHANFRLSAEHDNVVLSDSRGRLVDRVTLDNVPKDASYARNENGVFIITQNPTPGLPNTQEGASRMDSILRSLNPTGVYVTEVMASNDTAVKAPSGGYTDWVEIYNSSNQAVDLSGYGLSDNIGRARKWQFPQGTTINPGEYKVIWCDGDTALSNAGELHTSFKLRKSGGEVLVLADPTGKILDKVVLPEIPTNVSYGRSIGREGFFYYDMATAGAQNGNDTFLGYADAPELTLQPGKHYGTVTAGFTIPANTTVYYTTDGSTPTQDKGYLYTGQDITFTHTTTLRARAFPANPLYKASTVTTGTYLMETYYTTPIVCITVDPDAMFDIQSKRLHEYKRQQLNLLYLIHQYFEIRAGHTPAVPLVSIFGAKAAPAYIIAKDIIHALLTLSKVIAADPLVAPWLQVVFVENYNVTAAEKMIPACDLSEQISLASKEASGTGNMKFMLNGALTLGTMDGANVEISQQVGNENIYIFGQTSGQVIHRYAAGDYNPADWYEGDPNLRRAIDFLTGPEMLAAGKEENLARLQHELKTKDWFQTLPDFNAYVVRKGQALSDYACDPLGWRRKCLINISKAGFFSSDRTIAEYNSDIWHLGE